MIGRWRILGRAGRTLTLLASLVAAGAVTAAAQETGGSRVVESAVTLSSRAAVLELELADGARHSLALAGGEIRVDGEAIGSYEPGGKLDDAWRALLRSPAVIDGAGLSEALRGWSPEAGEGVGILRERIHAVLAAPAPPAAVPDAGGERAVAIAPGSLSLADLGRQLDELRVSLERLGEQAAAAEENLALVVRDDLEIPTDRVVDGNLALLAGRLSLAGQVRGDVLVLDGVLELAPDARVSGDVLQVGGEVRRTGGRVEGEIVSIQPLEVDAPRTPGAPERGRAGERARVSVDGHPRGFIGHVGWNVRRAVAGLVEAVGFFLALGALGLVVVYFFRRRLELVADTVRGSLGRSFAVGIAGQLLFFPVLLVLIVGVVTWLAIPVYLLAVALALPAGYLAVAHAVGETMSLQRYDWVERLNLRRSNSYWYVLSGLAVLLAPFAIGAALYLLGGIVAFLRGLAFFAAGVLTWAAVTTGFGAVILSRGGRREEYARAAKAEGPFDDSTPFAGEDADA